MKNHKTVTLKSLFLSVFKSKACNVTQACEAAKITRTTFYDWKKADPAFTQACDDIEYSLIDFAESNLLKNIQAGKEGAVIFFLCNRAPDRWRNVQRVEGYHRVETSDLDAARQLRLAKFLDGIDPGQPLLAAQTATPSSQRAEPSPKPQQAGA